MTIATTVDRAAVDGAVDAAQALVQLVPTSIPLTAARSGGAPVGPQALNAVVASYVGDRSTDMALALIDESSLADAAETPTLDVTDLLRPALYSAWHEIEPVSPRRGAPTPSDIVGPVCETADTFAVSRDLPPVEVGDLVAIRDTGAYGSVMASNYNRRPFAAEALTDRGAWQLVRRRQSVEDLLQWDV